MQEGQEYNLRDFKGDILGALAGGAVALPQSMGLGMFYLVLWVLEMPQELLQD